MTTLNPPQEAPGVPHGPRQRPGHQRPDDLSTNPYFLKTSAQEEFSARLATTPYNSNRI